MKKKKIKIETAVIPEKGDEMTEKEQIIALQILEATPGWKIVAKCIADSIEALNRQILEKIDFDGNPLTDIECDRLRDKRGYLRDIGATPQSIIAKIKMDSAEIYNGDPFE